MQDIEPADDQQRQAATRSGADGRDWSQAARWPASINAALWGLGNGLVSSTFVAYLVFSIGAGDLVLCLILAPQLIGLGRLGAARFTQSGRSRKRFCITAYLSSGMVLAVLPALAAGRERFSPEMAIGGVVAVWSLYHLLDYLALNQA